MTDQKKNPAELADAYLDRVRQALTGPADIEVIDEIVQEGQSLPDEVSYKALEAMCQLLIARDDWAMLLRQHAVGRYGKDAAEGDEEAIDLLFNYAKMAGDRKVYGCFERVTPEPKPAPAPLTDEELAAIGLEGWSSGPGEVIGLPRWEYTPPE